MKRILRFILLFISTVSFAQQPLSQSRHTSDYTYIYSLSNKEVLQLYTSPSYDIKSDFMHTLVDSFRTDKWRPPHTSAGNYLRVYADDNSLKVSPLLIPNVYCKIISNGRDLMISLHDSTGNEVKDAIVQLGKHTLQYEPATHTWGRKNYDKGNGILQITYKDVLNCVAIDRHRQYPDKASHWPRIKHVFRYRRYLFRHIMQQLFHPVTSYSGFMVFSKPIYKPADTLRLKAFILDKKGRPVNEPLSLKLSRSYGHKTDTVLTIVQPYRPGAYESQFILSEGLHLDLDERYKVSLQKSGTKIHPKLFISEVFEFEEYELHSVTFSARTDKKEHTKNEQVALYVKARDENDLAVMDGKVQVWIGPAKIKDYAAPTVFISDTLWSYSTKMDALGETKILIPDSIFPTASFSYIIHCRFLNSNNELRSDSVRLQYQYNSEKLVFRLKNDSLQMTYTVAGKSQPCSANLYLNDADDNIIQTMPVTLPATIKINPYAYTYVLDNKDLDESFVTAAAPGLIKCFSSRNRDTIQVEIDNPRKLFFWYTIYGGNKVKLRGYGDTLLWRAATSTPENYTVSIQYIWGGKVISEEQTVIYTDKELKVAVQTPPSVYPGQQTRVGITITDVNDKPVADADVTAYAFTSKFSASRPEIPDQNKYYKDKRRHTKFSKRLPPSFRPQQLDWKKWSREMGLDSIQRFRFRHPDPVFRYYEPTHDSVTQIAPFVIGKGEILPVHVLYINELPVYFSKAEQLERYTFRIKPGWNKIAMRTPYQQITYDSVFIKEGMKNILSIDTAIVLKNIHVEKRPLHLTEAEVNLLSYYMIRVENTFEGQAAYIRQNNSLYWLNHGLDKRYSLYGGQPFLVGPFAGAGALLTVKDLYKQQFSPEGGYEFNIKPGLIKQKQVAGRPFFTNDLFRDNNNMNLQDQLLEEGEINSVLNNINADYLRSYGMLEVHYPNDYTGKLVIHLQHDTLPFKSDILQFFLFGDDVYSFAGNKTAFGRIPEGTYKLVALLKNNHYFETDSIIKVKEGGINYYDLDSLCIQPLRNMSNSRAYKIRTILSGYSQYKSYPISSKKKIDDASLIRWITGNIKDTKGQPVPGASIILNGKNHGAKSDANGNFAMKVTPEGYLIAQSIGFTTRQTTLTSAEFYNIVLEEYSGHLDETVVIGYGRTNPLLALQGRVPGMNISYASGIGGGGKNVRIQGQSSIQSGPGPLILVNGLPYNGTMESISPDDIKTMEILNDEDARAIYGSRGAAGVIIITTGKGSKAAPDIGANLMQESPSGNSLRRNFHDDAFWQPKLRTNATGNTSFDVTFPDNITNWHTFVIAMTGKKQSGIEEIKIPSFKSLSANIGLPTFAIEGDIIHIIGKTLNYMPDSITASRTFAVNDSTYRSGMISFKNAYIDTIPVFIRPADSIAFKYIIQKEDYADGEEQKIPVMQQGTIETNGFFTGLYKDTGFVYTPLLNEPVKVYATSAVLPILLDEINHVQHYEYLCNEQLASKLKAFLLEKKIRPDFKGDKDIKEILRHLEKGKNGALWGWWGNTPVSIWVSRHVIEALVMAEEQGYKPDYNKQEQIDLLVARLNNRSESDSIGNMVLLSALNAKIDYKTFIDSFTARHTISDYDKLRLTLLRQKAGLPADIPSILTGQHQTLFGNIYWGEDSYSFFNNSIQETLLHYQILRRQGGYAEMLQKIRGYFLEQRKSGYWRNTYESSLILETILPDVMEEQAQGTAELKIGDNTITTFPYSTSLQGSVRISKKGGLPVYLTAYQQYQNHHPEKLSNKLFVTSSFGINQLKAGEPVILTVDVYAEASADYVMVEIPIPAGCSYNDKSQSWSNNEVHREYFKQKVSIFCSSLTKGKHTFTVSLLPRYTGSYNLNPVKAELQYFPVFMGREGMKKVEIR